jgi:hypothetical protein
METDLLETNIKHRFDHTIAKQNLKEKYASRMLFAYSGGMWQAGPELITHCNLCLAHGHFNPVLEDQHGNPVQVDAEKLKNQAQERWQEQMNAWFVEFESLRSQR